MLFSLALILLVGMLLGFVFEKIHLPSLLGMLITGIILGPCALDLIDGSILDISAVLRRIALIIILTRAGLNLNLSDLKKVGRPAVLMCFVPAVFEMTGTFILAPLLLGVTKIEAALMGAVIAAVSPAVVVPKMLKLMEEGRGTQKSIPQLILAGASVDDVFVIVMFSCFLSAAKGEKADPLLLVRIPTSVIFGIAAGIAVGFILGKLFKKMHMRDSSKLIIILSVSFLLVSAEDAASGIIGFSGLIAIMCMGISMSRAVPEAGERLSQRFSKFWVAAQIILFVLVGAAVDISYAASASGKAVILLFGVLIFRMLGVFCCLIRTRLDKKERLFCMIAYCPKATVQAAIGAVPLAAGLACGNTVLSVAVLSILITAPLGAFLIDITYKKLLKD